MAKVFYSHLYIETYCHITVSSTVHYWESDELIYLPISYISFIFQFVLPVCKCVYIYNYIYMSDYIYIQGCQVLVTEKYQTLF